MGLVNRLSLLFLLSLLAGTLTSQAETCDEAVSLLVIRHHELSGNSSRPVDWNELYHDWKKLYLHPQPDPREIHFVQNLREDDPSFEFYWRTIAKGMTRGKPPLRRILLEQYFSYRLFFDESVETLRIHSPGGLQSLAPMTDDLDDPALHSLHIFSRWLEEPSNKDLLRKDWTKILPDSSLVVYDTSVVGHSRNGPFNKFARVKDRKRLLSEILFRAEPLGVIYFPPAIGSLVGGEMHAARIAHLPVRLLPSFEQELDDSEQDFIDRMTELLIQLNGRLHRFKKPSRPYIDELNALALAQTLFESQPTIFITQNSSQFLSLLAASVEEHSRDGTRLFERQGYAGFRDDSAELEVEIRRVRRIEYVIQGNLQNRDLVDLRVLDLKTGESYETQFISLALETHR